MNLPNKLTIFRIILVPIIVVISYLEIKGHILGIPANMLIMLILFIIAALTDKLDGYLARSRNEVTTFGKFLDPIADKILVISVMIIFVGYGKIPSWIPIIVIFREFMVSGYRLIAAGKNGQVIAANIWGKLKTVTQMIALIFLFIDKYNYFQFINTTMPIGNYILNITTSLILTISIIATIFSGYMYLKNAKELLK